MRSFIALGAVAALAVGIWVGGLILQLQFSRQSTPPYWDWTDKASIGPIILLGSCKSLCETSPYGKHADRADYFGDAAYQGLAYYTMSAMSNDPFKLARLAGYYKGVQSAGGAVS